MGRSVRWAAVRWAAAATTLGLVLVAASCGGSDEVTSGGEEGGGAAPLVLASTSIWADVTANVACDGLATVESIVPVGADAHSFEPSLADRGRLEEAVLVVENGLDLEEALADTVAAAVADGAEVFTVTDHVTLRTAGDRDADHGDGDADHGDGDGDGDDDHDHGLDPHVWLDPLLVGEVLDPLARALVGGGGLDADAVDACVSAYRQQLTALDQEVADLVAGLAPEQRLLVTSHDSFGYFADRYGFEVIGTVIPSTSSLAEATPAALERLASLIESTSVRAIFTDDALGRREAQSLADRVGGVAVIALHTESLGEPGSSAATYLDLVRNNARLIVDGLRGDVG